MKKPSKATVGLAFAAATLILPLIPAQAATYYWKPNLAEPGLWTELSNWSTESIAGADAAALPGAGDSLSGGDKPTSNDGNYNFDLGGGDYTISGWIVPDDWDNHYLTLANGSLTFSGLVQTHSGAINVGSGGTLHLASGSEFIPGLYTGSGLQINVNDGGEMNVSGTVRLYSGSFNIASGGTMTFSPSYFRFGAESHSYALSFNNAGTLNLPNGFGFNRWDILTVDTGSTYAFTQTAGTLNLGGSFFNAPSDSSSKPGPFTVTISGGTVNITGDVAFNVTSATIENNVTFNFDTAHTVDFTGVAFGQGASITKTGAAAVALPVGSVPVTVSEGGLALGSGIYDLSSVTFASGTTIALASLGGTVSSYDSSLTANAIFTADLSGATVGTVVFISSDSTLRSKVETDLADSLPSGMSFVTIDNALILTAETAYDKIYDASGEIADIPGAGSSIAITGSGTVVTLSTAESIDAFKALGLIEVKDGAKLTISTDVDALPPIKLNMDATLEVAGGANLTFANVGDLSCIGNELSLPVLEVATNATLTVAGGMKFKNVDFRLYGTVAKPSDADASPVFGYADNGETSYFAFTADGGVFDFHSNQNAGCGSVSIVCPASGGTVIPVGTIILRNASRNVTGWTDFGNWEFGVNNPTSVGFDVLVDATAIDCSAVFHASGAAHLTLVNGSCIRRNSHCGGHYFSQAIQNAATVAIGEDCYLDFTTGDGLFGIDSQSAVDAVTVRDGGIYNATYNSSGWGQGVFVSDGGVLGVGKLYYSSSSGTRTPRSDLLLGFGSARLDGDLSIASVNVGALGNTDWERHTTMANVPFSGTGNVTVTNGVPAYPFTVTIRSGANTATGAIKVAKVAGDAETALYFADGANWAGTVVADGNVAITNLADAASPVTCSFGTLNLAADFPIRVWKSEGVVTNDTLNVGTYTGSGCIRVTGAALDKSEVLTIGTIGENAELPAKILVNGARYEAFVDNGFLKAKAVSGMTIVIK